MSHIGPKSEVFLPARHVRCTFKSERHQTQAEVHSIAHVSSDPYPAQLSQCLRQLQSLLARENLRPQPPAREIIPIEISGWPVAREL